MTGPAAPAARFRRTTTVRWRNAAEYSAACLKASHAGSKLGPYLRSLGGDAPMPARRRSTQNAVDTDTLRRLLGQIGRIGSNLNQLARSANRGRPVFEQDIREELNELRVIHAAILNALGRPPQGDP